MTSSMSSDEQNVSSSTDPISVLTISPHTTVELGDIKGEIGEDECITVEQASLLANQGYLSVVSPSMSNPTIQSLLASPNMFQGIQIGLPPGVQIVPSHTDLLQSQSIDLDGRVWQVLGQDQAVIAVGDPDGKQSGLITNAVETMDESEQVGSSDLVVASQDLVNVLMPPPATPLPPGYPYWASRIKSCEKIGNYFRGYVETEAELDILLTYHKQMTQSFWGTRQSPSPAKMSTRFMWKSQYVPYDGIPFVNTGSRAIVQECQFGPRRKGTVVKKQNENNTTENYKQTCPARIYIKKVRKFPEFKIDPSLDKKSTKVAMDKAFHNLKQTDINKVGQDRFYVQLPLQSAHEFHDVYQQMSMADTTAAQSILTNVESQTTQADDEGSINRLHPLVAQKIREVVAGGETRVYQVRRLLRAYVCREVYSGSSDAVQRHDLSLFPTVTDLKNHIHQAVKDIQNGTLALTAPTVNVEAMSTNGDEALNDLNVWPQNITSSGPVPETVTVTLTQGPGDDGGHVISRIETHLSDGTTQISSSLTPETAQLLARLNPAMFPPGSLVQLQATNQGPELNGEEKFDSTFGAMDMEVQDSSQFTDNLTIQTSEGNSLPMNVLGTVDASDLLTKENGSITEQNTELLNVAMVPVESTLEDFQEENSVIIA